METELIQMARAHAERILLANGGELGLLGSNQAYQQVWARDSMICGLGLWLTGDPEGRAIYARSLEILRRFQSPLGKIPHNVGMTGISDPALIAQGGSLGCHDLSGRTMGYARQSWSAAMYLCGAEAVEHGCVHIFSREHGWLM